MSVFEIIEQLCTVTRLQADIIEKQAEIADAVAAELSEKRQTAASLLDNASNYLS